jgi:adenylyltransferase/sulfurtransferase
VIVDGTDNFPARYLVNDACVIYGKPNAWGSIFRFEGRRRCSRRPAVRATAACTRSRRRRARAELRRGGRARRAAGIIGTIQATEAIKLILGIGDPLIGRFLVYDALKMRFRELKLPKDPDCPVCGDAADDHDAPRDPRRRATCAPAASAKCQCAISRRGSTRAARRSSSTCASRRSGNMLHQRIALASRSASCPACRRAGRVRRDRRALQGGGRSARAVALLREKGFSRASNLTGGILSWINEIDPSLARY